MTSKPKLDSDLDLVSGLAAVALFVVMAAVFLRASFEAPTAFPADASVTASLGYAMFNITGDFVPIAGEGMLAVFLIVSLVLDAALEGSVLLARRDTEGTAEPVPDGGTQGSLDTADSADPTASTGSTAATDSTASTDPTDSRTDGGEH